MPETNEIKTSDPTATVGDLLRKYESAPNTPEVLVAKGRDYAVLLGVWAVEDAAAVLLEAKKRGLAASSEAEDKSYFVRASQAVLAAYGSQAIVAAQRLFPDGRGRPWADGLAEVIGMTMASVNSEGSTVLPVEDLLHEYLPEDYKRGKNAQEEYGAMLGARVAKQLGIRDPVLELAMEARCVVVHLGRFADNHLLPLLADGNERSRIHRIEGNQV